MRSAVATGFFCQPGRWRWVRPGRIHHPPRAARAGTPVRSGTDCAIVVDWCQAKWFTS